MATLDAEAFNFIDRFPVPNDAERNKAGRQGLLDQKEDANMTDGDWVALQHQAWLVELRNLHEVVIYLRWAMDRGLDPATGRPPRSVQRWPTLLEKIKTEIRRTEAHVQGLLDDYSNYFGSTATEQFAEFVARNASTCSVIDAQGELF